MAQTTTKPQLSDAQREALLAICKAFIAKNNNAIKENLLQSWVSPLL